ncbi:MAG TPA: polymer-forming cytoskeletal protein [Chloroflexota bacterium]|nr:polymer-forming cytoskeletal protein [Chloroflexota bacterium]
MFGRKDSIQEFEQMRQALKPAERFANRSESDSGPSPENSNAYGANVSKEMTPASNIIVPPEIDHRSSVVSVGSSWDGTLKIDGSVRLEGQVSGEIDAKDTVFVAETAKVNAKVRAAQVIIAGSFEGEVDCTDRLQIMPTGRVKAQLTTKLLTVFEGAIIEGPVHMSGGSTSASTAASSTAHLPEMASKKPMDKPAIVSMQGPLSVSAS